jgi:hypothetical protein
LNANKECRSLARASASSAFTSSVRGSITPPVGVDQDEQVRDIGEPGFAYFDFIL